MNAQVPERIIHRPYGLHHPYDQEPEERFPRDPVAKLPVALGVKTPAEAKFDSVWAVWQSDKNAGGHRVDASPVEHGLEFDVWHVDLPSFDAGEKVRYTLFAANAAQQAQTEGYEFTPGYWLSYDHVISAVQEGEKVTIEFAAGGDSPNIQLQIGVRETGTLDFHYSQISQKPGILSSTPFEKQSSFTLAPYQVELDVQGAQLILNDPQGSLELKTAGPLRVLFDGAGNLVRYALAFDSPDKEAFWGFGERYNAIDQRGNSLRNRVIDQYKRQGKRTYYPVPFFISSRGYGFWVDTDREVTFDMAETDSRTWQIDAEAGPDRANLNLVVMPQGTPKEVIKEFTRLTSRPKMPPSWVFGLWMSSNDWNSQAEVMRQFELTHRHNIPATVLVIEAWSDEVNFYIWNDAQYALKKGGEAFKVSDFTFPKEGRWPDPKAMVDALHAAGTRLILWQNPTLKRTAPEEHLDERQNRIDEQYWIDNRLCVMTAEGDPYRITSIWFRGSLLADFTNPQTNDWWFRQREYLVKEMGVDGFKTDGGEHIWSRALRFSDGTIGKGRCNSYVPLYLGAYDRFLESIRGRDRFLFSRAGYTGAQKYPGHWAGDEESNWDAFRSNVTAMLNMGLCGEPFVGWDMGGFGNEPPGAELYLRSAAVSVFCPIMQYHSEYNARQIPSRDRTPWNIQARSGDDRVIPAFRRFTHLRMNLLPYIQNTAWRSCQSGVPMMRPLAIEYPHDPTAGEFPFEYLFGDALLIAPVIEEGKDECEVYLPEGKWLDFWTHVEYAGGRKIKMNVPLDGIPVFQREGSVVALNLDEHFTLGSDVGGSTEEYRNLSLRIYPRGECQFDLVRSQGDRIDTILVQSDNTAQAVNVNLPALDCPLELMLRMEKPVSVHLDGTPVRWEWLAHEQMVKIHLSPENRKRLVVLKRD